MKRWWQRKDDDDEGGHRGVVGGYILSSIEGRGMRLQFLGREGFV